MRNYNGEYQIPASREIVWGFLTDPNKVGQCLPDVLELDVLDQNSFTATVRVGVGPIRGKFKLTNSLTVVEEGYSSSMSVKGGGMGSGLDMSAKMDIEELGPESILLKWSSDVVVSGPIATIGGRLIDGQARKVTEQVFENIRTEVVKLATELKEDSAVNEDSSGTEEVAATGNKE